MAYTKSRLARRVTRKRGWVLNNVVIWSHMPGCNWLTLTLSDEIVSTLGEGTFGKVVEVKDIQK